MTEMSELSYELQMKHILGLGFRFLTAMTQCVIISYDAMRHRCPVQVTGKVCNETDQENISLLVVLTRIGFDPVILALNRDVGSRL